MVYLRWKWIFQSWGFVESPWEPGAACLMDKCGYPARLEGELRQCARSQYVRAGPVWPGLFWQILQWCEDGEEARNSSALAENILQAIFQPSLLWYDCFPAKKAQLWQATKLLHTSDTVFLCQSKAVEPRLSYFPWRAVSQELSLGNVFFTSQLFKSSHLHPICPTKWSKRGSPPSPPQEKPPWAGDCQWHGNGRDFPTAPEERRKRCKSNAHDSKCGHRIPGFFYFFTTFLYTYCKADAEETPCLLVCVIGLISRFISPEYSRLDIHYQLVI